MIYIHEYAGLATSPLDQVSSQTGTGTAVTSGAKTTKQANELIFGYASVDHCVISGGTGFSVRQTAGCNMSEDMIVSATGTYSATFTQNVRAPVGSASWLPLKRPRVVRHLLCNPSRDTSQSEHSSIGGTPLQLTATGTYSDSSKQNITSSCSWASGASGDGHGQFEGPGNRSRNGFSKDNLHSWVGEWLHNSSL